METAIFEVRLSSSRRRTYNNRMKIAVIGASGAGLYLSLFLKKYHPDYEVVVFDKNKKLGRKLLATGNGHCNLLNMKTGPEHFNHPSYLESYLKGYPFGELQHELATLGIVLTNEGDYLYPLSFSAAAHVNYLAETANNMSVQFRLETKVLDYVAKEEGVTLKTDQGNLSFDHVVFATGGKSQENLGSDGSLFDVFAKHGYEILPLKPGLCPIKTKENTKSLAGERHKAKVYVLLDDFIAREEEGEVLFKKDGLSGIVIFNCSSYISHLGNAEGVKIIVDLFPSVNTTTLTTDLFDAMKLHPSYFLDAYLSPALRDYVLKEAELGPATKPDKVYCYKLAKAMKGLTFHFSGTYDFPDSQVTIGGISIRNIDWNLRSTLEKHVSFAGEVLDVDGLCGGHNLTWCLVSSLVVSKSF